MKRSSARKNRWADHYTRQAKKDKYPARSVYKLQEIQKKFGLIKKGHHILDLGCAPGSWLLYCAEKAGPGGRVVGIDLKAVKIHLPKGVEAIVADITRLDDGIRKRLGNRFNGVINDMAPATTGHGDVDAARSLDLCQVSLDVAETVLLDGGYFITKIFQGADSKAFIDTIRTRFRRCKTFKPQSSRKASREIYIIGIGKHRR